MDMKIGVVGCAGRMGRSLVRRIHDTERCVVAGGIEIAGHAEAGRDIGELAGVGRLGLTVSEDARALFAESDAVLEFSTPVATATHAAVAAETGTVHVIGTTGLNPDETNELHTAAERVAIVWAPNMSVAVNLLLHLSEQVSAILDADYDVEIVEMHHRYKIDAPSGTALALGQAAARGRGVEFEDVAVRGRDGLTGARPRGAIGLSALRGGDVVGEHSVIFAANGERLELTHRAASRDTFSRGAVRAALWASGKPPGLYGMKDVLGR